MYLKKVEISGFKSFANKTTLEFVSAGNFDGEKKFGITAIVGPNGSGKSNVSDAIKWAMGEQSMKTLRGKKSEDIIFAGSAVKSRLSSAQVTLYFDNSDKRIPLEFSEVVISRKLFRSGESEYLINGSKVRLLDVVDILAKAGIGKESYCVINQGMSDAVLNATPVERRGVLEDAAGVKQYQIRKERALKKIENTKENMERVTGLIREIEPHLKMLKRQAEKAQQGKEIIANLKEKQTQLFSYLWHIFQQERSGLSAEKNEIGADMMNLQREVDKINEELSKESKAIENEKTQDELEKKRNEVRQQMNIVEKDFIVCEGRLVIEKERLANQKIYEIIPVDLKYVQEKLSKIRKDQGELIQRIESAENLEQLQDVKEFARVIQQELFDLYSESGNGEVKIQKDNSKESQEIQERINGYISKKEQLQKSLDEKKELLGQIENSIQDEIKKNRKSRDRFFELEREVRSKQEELNRFRDKFNDAKIKLARVEVREEDLTAEIKNELKCEVSDLKYDGQSVEKEKLEREISRMKMQMEQIGGIDPMIIEEYQETNTRFDFLSGELIDLEKAMESLRQVIKEMDQKINQEFVQAFEQINAEFSKYFRIIFGGGNAHLIKKKEERRKKKEESSLADGGNVVDEEDGEKEEGSEEEKEMGIDIFACPPGKKITNLSMLSGGERSLTSLALLFAIIAHNPPPFSILDEVEAALDEANSRRFSKILNDLSDTTQFIAISHNRETMRQASLLYGVTMGEDGISKLLSVHLDQIGQGGKIIK
ncbi:MAG: Chromosome segregation protein SMC [uncultured bacterium]|nr:MAG: Chromosome segregation protein SMC [uncultured bacterium]